MATETKSQRLTRQMKKDAQRQAKRREKMGTERRPETHAVDRAIVEALAYVVVRHHYEGEARRDIVVPFKEILEVAGSILTKGDRFALEPALKAIVARTKNRDSHLWTLPAPKRPKRDDSYAEKTTTSS